jgi:signal transduction histidine kinase
MKSFHVISCYLSLLLFISNNNYAQQKQIDSLEKWVAVYPKKDTVWIDNLISLQNYYSEYLSAKSCSHCNTVITYSKKLNYGYGMNMGALQLVYFYQGKGDIEKALSISLERLKYVENSEKNKEYLLDIYNTISNIYSSNNDKKAIKYGILAKDISTQLPNDYPMRLICVATSYIELANAYTKFHLYEHSLKEAKNIIEILQQSIENPTKLDISLGHLAYYQASAYQCISSNYNNLSSYTFSANYAKNGLVLCNKYQIASLKPNFYLLLLNSYRANNQYQEAKKYLKLLDQQQATNELTATQELDYLQAARDLYLKQNDYKKAYDFQHKYIALRDSTQGKEVQNKLNDLSIKYETEKKEQANKLLKNENDSIAARNQLYLALFIVAALLLSLVGFLAFKLRKTNNTLQQLNHIKDNLFAIIAHDLKRPANTFQNMVKVISYLVSKKQYDRLAETSKQAEIMATDMYLLIDNLFRWGLSQKGEVLYQPISFDLEMMFKDLLEEFKYLAQSKEINITLTVSTSYQIHTDKVILSAVFRNLISNALKFTPPQGHIAIEANSNNNRSVITVKDTGIGIPIALQKDLFILKNDKSRTGTAGEHGSGLGLMLCKQLLEWCKGSIEVSSEEGNGTTFIVKFDK